MSPLARLLTGKQQNGLSFREMERLAWDRAKIRYTSSSFEQVAKDQRARRLDAEAIRALAAVLEITPREVADLDDERWGIVRRHVAYGDSSSGDIADFSDEVVLAEAAKRLATRNPEAKP